MDCYPSEIRAFVSRFSLPAPAEPYRRHRCDDYFEHMISVCISLAQPTVNIGNLTVQVYILVRVE